MDHFPGDLTGRCILFAIAQFADKDGRASVGLVALARRSGVSRSTVTRRLPRLRQWVTWKSGGGKLPNYEPRFNEYHLTVPTREDLETVATVSTREDIETVDGHLPSQIGAPNVSPEHGPTVSRQARPDTLEDLTDERRAARPSGSRAAAKTIGKTVPRETPAEIEAKRERAREAKAAYEAALANDEEPATDPDHFDLLESSVFEQGGTS